MTDFVWGVPLLAIATVYAHKSRNDLPQAGLKWGITLAIFGFLLPLILNQLISSDFLDRFHKILAVVVAFVVFVICITVLRIHTSRRSSPR